jgi:hypothetical protein
MTKRVLTMDEEANKLMTHIKEFLEEQWKDLM